MSESIMARTERLEFGELRGEPELSLELARSLCRLHNLSGDCSRIAEGSQLVFSSADGHVIKVFSPEDQSFFETERVFLQQLYGRLPIATPRFDASGSWGKYPYVVMEQLEGVPLSAAWNILSPGDRRDIVSQLADATCALHALPPALFEAAPFRWQPFIEGQRAGLLAAQRSFGLEDRWLTQLDGYVASRSIDFADPARMGPLHTELMREHVLVRHEGSRWAISGLIDFEPSMVGHKEYEFCAVGLFITAGDRDLFRLFLSSYGYHEAELTEELSRRIMILMLLHRYGNLRKFLGLIPADLGLTELRQLETYWFGA
jgi:hygromycin-B 7''-O-kinase